MAKQEYSNYQKDVITNYYKNLDTIMPRETLYPCKRTLHGRL